MASPGDRVEVGDVIMELDTGETEEQETEEASEPEENEEEPPEQAEAADTEEKQQEATTKTSSSSGDVLALPKVRKLAEKKGVDLASIKTGERITEEEVLQAAESGGNKENSETEDSSPAQEVADTGEVNATPSVRKLAREKEINISQIEGTGRGGKITRQDVINAANGETPETETEQKTTSTTDRDYRGEVEKVEMSGIRKSIASKMEKSRFTAPHVTHVEKADITELSDLRDSVKNKVDAHLTYLPFIMKACTKALKDYPTLNAELDKENDTVIQKKYYDFNIAVDTDRGLLVPRIEDVAEKNMIELAEDIVEKAEAARDGSLGQDEMSPGTFSITNLGVIGGEEFTPIINYPQVAILGIGKIGETAEVVDGEVTPRTTVKLSLSYDHRVVDGATAAKFMNDVVENLENPEELMVNL
ncbi:Pyruvate/2-oxoglutarate dehydrogenase complex, dihydrolipoamide acyltransferase (E2) component [Candidatus Nanohalovita haloferacivicina]|nr:Pyruvate/2-oxoglutarate dehydrogenase complex, dihydrolipoamide acyltransferase (E2) component [Candidatus Nanohalobia archaeon BNXNv]